MSIKDAVAALSQEFGDRCTTSEAVRDHHSRGESYHAPVRPDEHRRSLADRAPLRRT